MSLESAIQERWRLTASLVALVPDNRVYLGWVPSKDADYADLGLPMVSVKRTETGVLYPSGPEKITEGEVTFRCWGETVAAANEVIEAIDDTFSGDSLPLRWLGGSSLCMLQGGMEQDRMDDGTWLASVNYYNKTTEVK